MERAFRPGDTNMQQRNLLPALLAVVLSAALLVVGPEALAASPAPLVHAVEAGGWSGTAPVVRVGAAVAAAGVLLSLLAGISRTVLAMARRRELQYFQLLRKFGAVFPIYLEVIPCLEKHPLS